MLQTWIVQKACEEAIIIATDEYFAKRYAEQMGFHGELKLVTQPTIIIRELDADEA